MAPRLDLYSGIHKGIRANMYETALLLSRTNFADDNERGQALTAVRTTLGFLDEHLVHEDTYVAPVLAEIAPDLAPTLAGQHTDHERCSAELKATVARLHEGAGDPLAEGAGLCAQFNALVAEQTEHMNLEESRANEVLWANRTDEQLAEIRGAIQGSIPPERFGEFLAIMLPNMNYHELTGMLGGIKTMAPPPVFEVVSGIARDTLGDRWAAIEAAL